MDILPHGLIDTGVLRGIELGARGGNIILCRNEKDEHERLHVWMRKDVFLTPAIAEFAEAKKNNVSVETGISCLVFRNNVFKHEPDFLSGLIADIETIAASGETGHEDIVGRHGSFEVTQCDGSWHWKVTCAASGRPSLKRIGHWTGQDNTFNVPFSERAALERLLTKTEKAAAKTVTMPDVPGVSVRTEEGDILIGWPGSHELAKIIKAVPTARWDRDREAYTVSARYAKRTAAALVELAAAMEDDKVAKAKVAEERRLIDEARAREAEEFRKEREARTRSLMAEDAASMRKPEPEPEEKEFRIRTLDSAAPKAGTTFRTDGGAIYVAKGHGKAWKDRSGKWQVYTYCRDTTDAEKASLIAVETDGGRLPELRFTTMIYDYAPRPGRVFRYKGEVGLCVSLGETKYIRTDTDEELCSFYSSEFWERTICTVTWRLLTDEEKAAHEAAAA
jgi:hypothetical protein